MKIKNLSALLLVALLFVASCSKDKDETAPSPEGKDSVTVITAKDLPADPHTRDEDGNVIPGTNEYTFYRFSDSSIVANSDSASDKWDIGFRGTSIILNSGVNGPGKVEGQVVKNTLEDIMAAPKEGYQEDAEDGNVFADWYNYNMDQHIITPVPGYILVIHTHDNRYVKLEILSYYQGSPSDISSDDVSGYYTFRYVIQADGSRAFRN